MKDKRKRIRCKSCKKRVNLFYKAKEGVIKFACPKCLSQGTFRINKKI